MYKLFKVALVMLAFAVYTAVGLSNCRCHDPAGNPDNSRTQRCCVSNPLTVSTYGCNSVTYSNTHHRCDCDGDGMVQVTNVQEWSDCCYLNGADKDRGYDCVRS